MPRLAAARLGPGRKVGEDTLLDAAELIKPKIFGRARSSKVPTRSNS